CQHYGVYYFVNSYRYIQLPALLCIATDADCVLPLSCWLRQVKSQVLQAVFVADAFVQRRYIGLNLAILVQLSCYPVFSRGSKLGRAVALWCASNRSTEQANCGKCLFN